MKKYQIIYADPPWKIQNASKIWYKCYSPIEYKYPTMDLEQIKKLPIAQLTDTNCGLFLWTTHTFLEKAFEVLKSWGFNYHCCITWYKKCGFSVWGFHRNTEFCLYAYKGKININQKGKFIPTFIMETKRKHSQKPDIVRKWIESNTPEPRLELFARQKTEGWDVWGNEVESDINLEVLK